MEQILIVLSGLAMSLAYLPFIKGGLNGSITIVRSSWIVWFIQDALLASSALAAGAGTAAFMPMIWFCGAGIIVLISLTKGQSKPFAVIDWVCLALSGVGIILWMTTGSPLLALVTATFTLCVGSIPAVANAWKNPESETPTGWILFLAGTTFNALAIKEWTFTSGLIPVAAATIQILIILPVLLYTLRNRSYRPQVS